MTDRSIESIIIDFDSTLVAAEGIEMLVAAGLQQVSAKQRQKKLEHLKSITSMAMNGALPFARALQERLKLATIGRQQVARVAEEIRDKVNPLVKETVRELRNRKKNIFIFSGGFRDLVCPVASQLDVPDDRTFANQLIYDKDDFVIGVEQGNPLIMSSGKVFLAEQLRLQQRLTGRTIVIGDGFSDLAIRKLRVAELFIYFSGCVDRRDIRKEADFVIARFNQLIPLMDQLEAE